VSNSTSIRPTLIRDEAGRLLGQTMGLGAVTAGAFALGAYLYRSSGLGAVTAGAFALGAYLYRSSVAAMRNGRQVV
jgi:hypothetical protein